MYEKLEIRVCQQEAVAEEDRKGFKKMENQVLENTSEKS